jgi:hypothetical protein
LLFPRRERVVVLAGVKADALRLMCPRFGGVVRPPWMNMVEIWFGIIERQAIHRGSFGSVKDLNTKIRAFIDGWNDRAHPFLWTKTTDQILAKAKRPTITHSGHLSLAPNRVPRGGGDP